MGASNVKKTGSRIVLPPVLFMEDLGVEGASFKGELSNP